MKVGHWMLSTWTIVVDKDIVFDKVSHDSLIQQSKVQGIHGDLVVLI